MGDWKTIAAIVGVLLVVQSCNVNNMKRAYLGVGDCVHTLESFRSDEEELAAWRRCSDQDGWERWRSYQSDSSDAGSDP